MDNETELEALRAILKEKEVVILQLNSRISALHDEISLLRDMNNAYDVSICRIDNAIKELITVQEEVPN